MKLSARAKLSKIMAFFDTVPRPTYFGLAFAFCWMFGTQRFVHNDINGSYQVVQYLGVSCACISLAIIAKWKDKSYSPGRVLQGAGVVLATLCSLLLIVPNPLQDYSVLIVFGGFFSGGICGWLYLAWGTFYAKLSIKPTILVLFCSLILASLVKVALAFVASEYLGAIVCALFPVISLLCWNSAIKQVAQQEPKRNRFNPDTLYVLKNTAVGVVLFTFAIGVFMSFNFQVFNLPPRFYLIAHALTILFGIGVIGVAYWWREDFEFSNMWLFVLVAISAGLVVVNFNDGSIGYLSLSIFTAAQMFIIVFLYLAIADVAHNSMYRSDTVFGFGWSLFSLPTAFGFMSGYSLQVVYNHLQLSLTVLFFLMMALFFFMRERNSKGLRLFSDFRPLVTGDRLDQMAQQIDKLATKHDLSSREKEVIALYAQGRNRAFISSELFISENTVRDHIKSTYKKMKIHSKQELIDRIQDAKPA